MKLHIPWSYYASMDRRLIWMLTLMVLIFDVTYGATHQGCYREENKKRRLFRHSPGDYNPDFITPGICAGKCGALSIYKYCAVTQGGFCFCGNTLPSASSLDAGGTLCSYACTGDSGTSCGGPDHINVYTTSPSIEGLELSFSPSGVVATQTNVAFSATLSAGADNLEYQMDYDDGTGRTDKNATGMWDRFYPVPGQYEATVYAVDQAATLVEKESVIAVMVESPVSNVILDCPDYMATYEEGSCLVTILEGTTLNLYNYVNGVSVINGGSIAVADPLIYTVGQPVKSTAPVQGGEITADTIVMPVSEFQQAGRLLGFEFYAEVAGNVNFLILQPSCGGLDYCFDTNNCVTAGTCAGIYEKTCSAGLEFCPSSHTCWNSGTSTCSNTPTRYDGTQRTNLNILNTITYNIPSIGYQYYALDLSVHNVQVSHGYILGYIPTAGRIASVTSNATVSDLKSSNIANSGSAVSISKRHMLKAIISGGSSIKLPYTFTVPGTTTIDVNVTNVRLPNYVFASDTVQVVEGINMAIPDLPQYVKTGSSVQFKLLQHTGTSVNYYWDYGDGSDVNTTSSSHSKSYSTRGTYTVNITAHNQLSTKENTTTIVVQDEILGLALTGSLAVVGEITSLGFTITSGSDFTCQWSITFGSSTTTVQTVWPSADNGIPFNYTFTNEGTHSVSVTCSNNVSTGTASLSVVAEQVITGFQLEKTGAVKDTPYSIVFTWTAGTNPSFTLVFNGNPCTISLDLVNRRGECGVFPGESVIQSYPLNLTATNLVSSEKIDVMFGIEVPMENVIIWSNASIDSTLGYAIIARDDFLLFSVNMTTGSNVVVNWDYGNGYTETYTLTNPLGWQPGDTETRIYQFTSLQFYDVVVTASNAYSTISTTYRILAIAPVENLVVTNVAQILFEPPSVVEFSFSQTSGLPPNEATMVIEYGDSKTDTIYPFDLNTKYYHTYREDGDFSVSINISNIVSYQVLSSSVKVLEKLVNVEIIPDPAHAPRGNPVNVQVTLGRGGTGTDYTLEWNMGDGTTVGPQTRTAQSPDGMDVVTHTYSTLSSPTYTITVTARSPLETLLGTYIIYCQDQVTTDVVLMSNYPQDFVASSGTIELDVQYNGNPLPTDAYIQIDYGDGSGPGTAELLSTYINSVGGVHRFLKTYASDGNYVSTVTIYNKVSSHTFQVPTGVYKDFVGLGVTPMYRRFPPVTSSNEVGFGPSNNIFPIDRPVRFIMTKTEGTHVYYEVYGASTNDIILCNKTEEYEFEIEFANAGTYTMTITAINPLYQKTVSTTVIVTEPVNITSIDDGYIQTPAYQNKVFNITFVTIGTDTCLVVEYGDGAVDLYGNLAMCAGKAYVGTYQGNITALIFPVVHQYTTTGTFIVKAHGFNDYSETKANFTAVISSVDCSKPRNGIKDQAKVFFSPNTNPKGQRLRVIGITDINCASTLSNTKSWTVVEVDGNTGDDIRIIDVSSNPSAQKAELSLDKLFLDYGVYRITYEMTMDSSVFSNGEVFSSEVSTYIKIVKSDLVLNVFDGGVTKVRKGMGSSVTLSPETYSYDPDLNSAATQTFTNFTWRCREITESYPITGDNISLPYSVAEINAGVPDYGGCFRNGPGSIDTAAGTLTFNTANMHVNKTYEFNVKVFKDTRMTETNVYLEIIEGTPPELRIECSPSYLCVSGAEGQIVRPDARLGFVGACTSGCTTTTTYKWEIYTKNHKWPDGWKEIEELDTIAEGVTSNAIAIDVALFTSYPSEKYQVRFYAKQSDGTEGMSAMNLIVNYPPSGGNCTISPMVGTALQTTFSISLTDWQDNDGIEDYQVYCIFLNDPVIKQITYGFDTNYNVKLPMGPDYNEFKEDCYVRIKDTLGSSTDCHLGQIQVNAIPIDEIRADLSSMKTQLQDDFDKVIARGDVTEVNEYALLWSTCINLASKNSSLEYKGLGIVSTQTATGLTPDYENRTNAFETTTTNKEAKDKYENEREDSSQMVTTIVDAMKTVTISTMQSIALTGSTLSEVVQYPELCARPCQEGLTEVGNNMVDTFVTLSSEATVEELIPAAQGILSFLNNAKEAGIVNRKSPGLGDLKRAKDTDPVYDTDYMSSQKGIPLDANDPTDAETAFLTNVNEELQITTFEGVENVANNAETSIRNVFLNVLIPGEKPVNIQTDKINLSFQKNHAGRLANKEIDLGAGGVRLPNDFCSLMSSCASDKTVMIQASYAVFVPNSHSSGASDLSTYSGSVDFSAFDDNGNKLTLSNAQEPIRITVPLDRNMPIENAKFTVPFIPDREDEFFFYQSFEFSTACGSAQIIFRPEDITVQFLAVIKFGGHPDVTTRDFDTICLIPNDINNAGFYGNSTHPDPYTCFVSTGTVGGYKGKAYIGIRELTSAEHDVYTSNDTVPSTFVRTDFTTNYTIKISEACCKWWDTSIKDWSCEGCMVSSLTTSQYVVCECTHATTFAGGWVVVPNTIDWNFVFSNADFFKNPTLYITEIVIALVYLISVIWARRQDKRDLEKLGLTPLKDNDSRNKYYYEIVVVTGMRRNAGTESKVHFILSGELEETEVRSLVDDKRKVFQRGNVDGFLMACPRPLGNLNYLRIWHDNSGKGKFASWYMRSFVVRDVQTDEKFIFISNRWFAVEEDDGQVDRIIPVAGKEQMTEFSHLFSERTTKSLSDGHLWFSVVARPPQSRFTRVQRVSCCLCLLYMTMLTSAMWYGQETQSGNAVTFGPFALSTEQIFIGVASNLIVFPVNFLIIALFRKSRPRRKRPSRVEEALHPKSTVTSMTDVNPTIKGTSSAPVTSSQLLEGHQRPDTSASRPGTSMSIVEVAKNGEKKKKKKKFELPWWFVIVAWILLWTATIVSAAFVTFYGISFQDVKCKKWITSLLVAFFSSVFITQPIKVFLAAIIFSLIVKNPGGDDDDEEDDEEKPKLATDEDFLHERDNTFGVTRPRKVGYKPPDARQLERARDERMKEIKMWAIVREIVFYAFFLWILLVISYRNRSYNMYLYKNSMERVFIITNETSQWFAKMKNTDEFWKWASTGLVNGIRAGGYYNSDPPLFLRGYVDDKVSRLMGYATMRQVRVKKDTCRIPDQVKSVITECNGEYSMADEDKDQYQVGWKPMTGNASADITREEYTYIPGSELDGYPYWGEMAVYSGGGYVVRLRGNKTVLKDKMDQLKSEGWIDRYTRAVFVEFTAMNPGINLFAISMLISEFRPSGGIFPSYRFEPAMLLPYMDNAMLFQLACEITYLIFIVVFLVKEARALYRQRCAYFKEFWNLIEMSIIIMSISATVMYFYRLFEVNKLTERFRVSHGNEYMKFQYVGYWSEMLSYMIGWLVFFASLKFLKLLRFNKRMSLLASTLKASCKDLLHFSIIFNIVFLAFIQVFYLIFVANIKDFKTFISSVESGIVMMMGKFDIYDMIMVDPILTQICLFFYVLTITFIIVNMFLSILNETFGAVRGDAEKQCNDYEIVEFMLNRFKMWTGFGTPNSKSWDPNDQAETVEGKIDNFPDRIDQLLNSIHHMYMEKDRLDSLLEENTTENMLMKKNIPSFINTPRSSIYEQPFKKGLTAVQTN